MIFTMLSYLLQFLPKQSPWYNHTGWLSVKYQLTYVMPKQLPCWRETKMESILILETQSATKVILGEKGNGNLVDGSSYRQFKAVIAQYHHEDVDVISMWSWKSAAKKHPKEQEPDIGTVSNLAIAAQWHDVLNTPHNWTIMFTWQVVHELINYSCK